MLKPNFHEKRRQKFLEEKEKLERRWSWLATLIAGLTVAGFRILGTYLQFCFSCLEQGPQGFLFLIGLHLAVILTIIL